MDDEKRRTQTRKRVSKHRAIQRSLNEQRTKRARLQFSDESRRTKSNAESATTENLQSSDGLSDSDALGFTNIDSPQEDRMVVDVTANEETDGEQEVARNIEESSSDNDEEQENGSRAEEINGRAIGNIQEPAEVAELRNWAIASNIPQNKIDKLLVILRRRLLPNLPKSAKTFLGTTEAIYDIQEMGSADGSIGEFAYFGIEKGLTQCIQENAHRDKQIFLQINIDGLPLSNSGVKQFWPILCKVYCDSDIYHPFPVAIYCGNGKPSSVDDYLSQLVEEINKLLDEGVTILGQRYEVHIHCFICDTPARSFLKCTKGHGGYWACERCETRGMRVERRTVYPEVSAQERTDESFRLQTQNEHHCGRSPLLDIQPPIDIVSCFALDFMHLGPGGIMKKIAEYLIIGKAKNRQQRRVKLGSQQRKRLSQRMMYLRKCIPAEFQRKPRSMDRIAQWKATEFRFFLLYCGPIVLRGILSPRLYKHFLLLHTACRILCDNDLAFTYNNHAKMYLTTFFTMMSIFYGRQAQILNSHNLIHLANDVMSMNCTLSKISAFPFENLLGKMKKQLRNANRPLAQMCRRMHEIALTQEKPSVPPEILIEKWSITPVDDRISIQRIKYKGFIITPKMPNNLVLLNNGVIMHVTKISCLREDSEIVELDGNEWKPKAPVFRYPTNSKDMNMWLLASEPSVCRIRCNVQRVKRKMVQLRINESRPHGNEKIYGIPFLHE